MVNGLNSQIQSGGGYILLTKEFIIRLSHRNNGELTDYKVHCFNGEPKITLVCSDRFSSTGLKEDFFDENWNHLPIRRPGNPNSKTIIKMPDSYNEMKKLARILSQKIPFVRIDF